MGFFSFSKIDSQFLKNIAVTSSASVVSILLQLVFTPIISRYFTPEAYGVLAIFNVIISNAILIIPLGYQGGLVLPPKDYDFFALAKLILILSVVGTVVMFLVFGFAGSYILDKLFNYRGDILFIYLIPVCFLTTSLLSIYSSYLIRHKKFKKNSSANVLANLSSRIFTVSYGVGITGSGLGLVLGQLTLNITNLYFTAKGHFLFVLEYIRRIPIEKIKSISKEYIRYPSSILPSLILNNLALQMSVWLLAFHFSTTQVGYYSFAVALLNIPFNVISNSIRPVFFQKATELHNNQKEKELRILVIESFNKLIFMSAVPIAIMISFSDKIFGFIFGSQWTESGVIVSYIGLSFFYRMLTIPFVSIRNIKKLEKGILKINILFILIKLSVFLFGFYKKDFHSVVLYDGIVTGIFFLINCLDIIKIVGGNILKCLGLSIATILVSLALTEGFKYLVL
jgi:O-antigen/teichoic acid export membrane protein